MIRSRSLCALAVLLSGCASPAGPGECEARGETVSALSAVDRALVSTPAAYAADATLASREAELATSQRYRREVAWQIVERVLRPVLLPAALGVAREQASLPAWQTWHAKDDLTRAFRKLYGDMPSEERRRRRPPSPEALSAAFGWSDRALQDEQDWTAQRLEAYRLAVDEQAEVSGLSGVHRVSYAPGASARLLESFGTVLDCRDHPELADQAAELPVASGCEPAPIRPPCLTGSFGRDAVLVKADFRRAELGATLPVFDTSAERLARRMSAAERFSWEPPDGQADPDASQIHTLKLPNGNMFRLAALHIMTKELDHWVWITLWWSSQADQDFGADRPASVAGVWRHYKMCTTVAFDERDPARDGGYERDHPSLASALATTRLPGSRASWCSNPYLELGAGNAATNCIGCHQHAGVSLAPEVILGDESAFPDHGRSEVRGSFPTDYVFAPIAGDRLGAMFAETEQHFD